MILGIGIDLVDLERLRGVIARHGDRFVGRILTGAERAFCEAHVDQAPHVGARFAAKEAAVKALGTGVAEGISWRDIEIVRAGNGAPSLELHGPARQAADRRGVRNIHVSLTHDRTTAAAVVVLEGAP